MKTLIISIFQLIIFQLSAQQIVPTKLYLKNDSIIETVVSKKDLHKNKTSILDFRGIRHSYSDLDSIQQDSKLYVVLKSNNGKSALFERVYNGETKYYLKDGILYFNTSDDQTLGCIDNPKKFYRNISGDKTNHGSYVSYQRAIVLYSHSLEASPGENREIVFQLDKPFKYYTVNGKPISYAQLRRILRTDPKAAILLKKVPNKQAGIVLAAFGIPFSALGALVGLVYTVFGGFVVGIPIIAGATALLTTCIAVIPTNAVKIRRMTQEAVKIYMSNPDNEVLLEGMY